LVEHLICNQGVAGSNPAGGTSKINRLILKSIWLNEPCDG
jgi:hypothetical protein